MLTIERNRTTAGYQVVEGEPKTAAGRRAVALDKHTVQVLREHRRRQQAQRRERLAAGQRWQDSGYVFVRSDGQPIHPDYATNRFRNLVQRTGLHRSGCTTCGTAPRPSPTRPAPTSRPCRTCSATPASWSPPTPTPASCPQIQRRCADATAQLVLTAARRTRKKIKTKAPEEPTRPRTENRCPSTRRPKPKAKPQVSKPKRAERLVQQPRTHGAPT